MSTDPSRAGLRPIAASVALALACGLSSGCSPDAPGSPGALESPRWLERGPLAEAPMRGEPVALRKRIRAALSARSGEPLAFDWPEREPDRLQVSLGARRDGSASAPTTATFEVRVRDESGAERVLLREDAVLSAGVRQSDWLDRSVDLSGPEGGSPPSALILEARSEDPALALFWGDAVWLPRIGAGAGARPDVVLLSIDTLGTRHMSLYGYERDTTPELARFAQDAVTFDQAITQQSWTLTAHASLFSAQYPDTHRVTLASAFAEATPLLPALLRDVGYATVGWINNPYLGPVYGYGAHFDRYDFDHETREAGVRRKRSVEATLPHVADWLDAGPPRPAFLFLHLIDTHSDWHRLPYDAPEPFRSRFLDADRPAPPVEWEGRRATDYLAAVNRGLTTLAPEQVEYFRALYDGSIAYTDHHVGRFFALLKRHGIYDDALIIVTSDHGEEFLQHGQTMHTQGFDEVLRVPLLIKLPGNRLAGTRVASQVQHVDVVPTVLDALGLEPPPALEGHSLLPLIEGRQRGGGSLAISKGGNRSLTDSDVYVAREEGWKLIWDVARGRTQLFDLSADPDEQRDVAAEQVAVRDRLHQVLVAHRRERNAGFHLRVPSFASPEMLEVRVRSTGPLERVTVVDSRREPGPAPWLTRPSENELVIRLSGSDDRDRNGRRAIGVDFALAAGENATLEIGGEPRAASPARIRLGAEGASAPAAALRFAAGQSALSAAADGSVPVPSTTPEPLVYLWETQTAANPEAALSEGDEEALRALGYIVD